MNRKECLKIMVRCVAFVVVFSMLFGNATDLLMRHDDESNEIHAFYSEPEDTIDVLYVGSSPLLRGVSPMVMWQEHGFTGYVPRVGTAGTLCQLWTSGGVAEISESRAGGSALR